MERFGMHFVASPRHADLLLVTGPVTRNMETPLRKTYEATPDPKLVVAVGECARTCGVFKGSYAIAGSVADVIPVDVFVAGCPPEPADILRGILAAVRRRDGSTRG
jgi:Ni,Fe-hydrogenase III small subunit